MGEYDRNPNDPNYVQDQGRRRIIRGLGWTLGAMATATGVYEFVTVVVPAVGKALGVSNKENTNVSADWFEHPSQVLTPSSNEQGYFNWTLPANSIAWEIYESKNSQSSPIILTISVETTGIDQIISNDGGQGQKVNTIEIYKPVADPVNYWHELLLYKKASLIEKYGRQAKIWIAVNPTDGGGNIFSQQELIQDIK